MLNDEMLGAYIDGELGPAQKGEVERLLSASPGARVRLERMRNGDDALRRAFAAGCEKGDNLAELVQRGWPKRPAARLQWAVPAIAAACLLGIFAGRITSSPDLGPGMHLSADMAAVLERAQSGVVAPVSGGEMQVALSFQTEAGAACRQYRASSQGQSVDGVACREDGEWRIAVQAAVREEQTYRTAAANDPIAAAVERLGGALVLDAAEERALISAHWSSH